MDKAQRETSDLRRLRRRRSAGAGGAPVKTWTLEGQDRPLVLSPRLRDLDLAGWAAGESDFFSRSLLEHGALLLRGFQLDSVSDFERFAAAVCDTLYGEYGDLPPEQEGTRVYHSTPYPADKTILFHNESSHLPRWPMKQFFFCVQPSEIGGETPIVDGRALLATLPAGLVETFERKGLLYVRNFVAGLDVSWRDFFKTDERAAVEERCRRDGTEWEWRGDDLQTRQRCRAVARHPVSGERVWFNQLQLHHPACLDAGMRASMGSVFREDALPRNVTFGDGTPIPDEVVREISETYWREATSFPWQRGDVLMVDNMLVAHARKPFQGERKIVVAMGDMMTADEL